MCFAHTHTHCLPIKTLGAKLGIWTIDQSVGFCAGRKAPPILGLRGVWLGFSFTRKAFRGQLLLGSSASSAGSRVRRLPFQPPSRWLFCQAAGGVPSGQAPFRPRPGIPILGNPVWASARFGKPLSFFGKYNRFIFLWLIYLNLSGVVWF